MQIDLSEIMLKGSGELTFDSDFTISEELISTTELIRLENLHVTGKVIDLLEYGYEIDMDISGTMILPCSLTLEETPYEFKTHVNETIEKDEKITNTLDITDVLWDNIVLEIPLKVVNEKVKGNFSGEDWEVKSEYINPELEKLKELYKEEE